MDFSRAFFKKMSLGRLFAVLSLILSVPVFVTFVAISRIFDPLFLPFLSSLWNLVVLYSAPVILWNLTLQFTTFLE